MKTKQALTLTLFILLSLLSSRAQTRWYYPANDSLLPIQGRGWNREIGSEYQRLPARAQALVRPPVWDLSRQTAGLYIQFTTNSPTIRVEYQLTGGWSMPHMPATGVSGVDLYALDSDGHTAWCAADYRFGDTVRYTYNDLTYRNNHSRGSEYTLYLPLYNGVQGLRIGVPSEYRFAWVAPSAEKPIVVYGTSIAQGACASRPGMAWTNILQRRLEIPVVNLGFSGNGQLDESMFHLLAETDAALYVIDCMPNMTNERTAWIVPRLAEGIRILRSHSAVPILLVEHDGYMGYRASQAKEQRFRAANRELRAAYDSLKATVPGLYLMTFEELGLSMDSQVDGVHATDLGMQQYADAYCKKIADILFPELGQLSFTPSRQHRDADTYVWNDRHNAILTYNASTQPEIVLLGNSITHFWGGEPFEPRRVADDVWQELFRGKRVVNLGYGWDRIENMQWRILHGELEGYRAQKIFMMLGTNNLDVNTDEEIVRGIRETIEMIGRRQPEAELYLIHILPRRGAEARLRHLNARLTEELKTLPHLHLLDLTADFVERDGTLDETLFSDGLHPNHKGYQILAKRLKPCLR